MHKTLAKKAHELHGAFSAADAYDPDVRFTQNNSDLSFLLY
jgi:hypothetical protein